MKGAGLGQWSQGRLTGAFWWRHGEKREMYERDFFNLAALSWWAPQSGRLEVSKQALGWITNNIFAPERRKPPHTPVALKKEKYETWLFKVQLKQGDNCVFTVKRVQMCVVHGEKRRRFTTNELEKSSFSILHVTLPLRIYETDVARISFPACNTGRTFSRRAS